MDITKPQHTMSHYMELALRKIRSMFPEADPSCFSGRYVMEDENDGPVFVDTEASWEYPGKWYPQTLDVSEEYFVSLLAKDGLKSLLNCVLHSGSWSYSLPATVPDAHGRRVAARMASSSLDRFYEWGIDAKGFPYERYERSDGPVHSDNSYLKRITFQDFRHQLTVVEHRFKGSDHEQAFRMGCAEFIRMAEDAGSRKHTPGRFVIYDLFRAGTETRFLPRQNAPEIRLEKYGFVRNMDGTVAFEAQVGWFAGSHYDGCGNTFKLPPEWFSLSWNGFLDRFTEQYPEKDFSFGRSELAAFPGLKDFLGFGPAQADAARAGNDGSCAEHPDCGGSAPFSGEAGKQKADGQTSGTKRTGSRKMSASGLEVGRWCYSAPTLVPNAKGCLVATQMTSTDPCEYYEWGIDGQGLPYERYENLEAEGRRAGEKYRKTLSPAQFAMQLKHLETVVSETEAEGWADAYAEFAKITRSSLSRVTKADAAPSAAPLPTLKKTWFCTECGTRHTDGRFCTECGALRYELRQAEKSAVPCRPAPPKKTIILERDSVSMGDDCHAPHTCPMEYDGDSILSEFMSVIADYLPPMRYMGWLVCCGAERLAMLYSDGGAKYSWQLLVTDRKLASLPGHLYLIQESLANHITTCLALFFSISFIQSCLSESVDIQPFLRYFLRYS